ncbi:MAG: ABC transporter permease subunit [marine benthic group bacterium]|nr:ABC transporter permease subunit [Gemmatimonadota bacterium]
MIRISILFPRLVRDRFPRAAVATAVLLSLTVPLLMRGASDAAAGVRDGISAGPASGTATVIPIVALLLALAAAWLADGVVSDLKRDGSAPLVLTRPVSRIGYFTARWLAGFACLAGAGLVTALVLNGAARFSGFVGPGLSPVGALGAAAASWLWVGSAVLVLSSLLERGEALAGALLLVLPFFLTGMLAPGNSIARVAAVLPSRTVLDVSRTLLAGDPVIGSHLGRVAAWGAGSVALGLFLAVRREWSASG